MNDTTIFRWLLNTEKIWPIPRGESAISTTAQWATGKDADSALRLVQSHERDAILRFYRPQDAKLCLGSFLLKHLAVSQACDVSWSDATLTQDHNKKPCFRPDNPAAKRLEFNVSHHGTILVLVGSPGETRKVGVDVVQINLERDHGTIKKRGFLDWVNIYEAVFSEREIADILQFVPPGYGGPAEEIRFKLRYFYAHWCLKEAFIKMTGEALMAPWLKDLVFLNVQVPPFAKVGEWGERSRKLEIWLHGEKVTSVTMELQAFGEEYLIATAISEADAGLPAFKELDLRRDVISRSFE
ncbi:hypothetical protein MMC12_003430 [Toensbergia leucococca]|nr:hypothetical protein [Toensbergia leucococca]